MNHWRNVTGAHPPAKVTAKCHGRHPLADNANSSEHDGLFQLIAHNISGWWLSPTPLKKYESQWEGLSHILWKIKMFQTTNQIFICIYQPNMEFLEFRIRFFSQYHRKFASFTRHHFCSRAGNSPHAHTCWPFGSRAAATPRRSAGVRGIQLRRYRLKKRRDDVVVMAWMVMAWMVMTWPLGIA